MLLSVCNENNYESDFCAFFSLTKFREEFNTPFNKQTTKITSSCLLACFCPYNSIYIPRGIWKAAAGAAYPHAMAHPDGAYAHAITHVQGIVTACSWNTGWTIHGINEGGFHTNILTCNLNRVTGRLTELHYSFTGQWSGVTTSLDWREDSLSPM